MQEHNGERSIYGVDHHGPQTRVELKNPKGRGQNYIGPDIGWGGTGAHKLISDIMWITINVFTAVLDHKLVSWIVSSVPYSTETPHVFCSRVLASRSMTNMPHLYHPGSTWTFMDSFYVRLRNSFIVPLVWFCSCVCSIFKFFDEHSTAMR